MIPIVEGFAESGRRIAGIAELLGVDPSTLRRWRNEHPELEAAIERGRAYLADGAEDVLLALTQPHDEVIERETPHGLIRITKKNVVNVKALLRGLEAYKPERWGNKVEHKGTITLAEAIAAAVRENES